MDGIYAPVIAVVQYKNKFLLLKRTPERRSSPGKWQTVSGFLRERESADEAALREVEEETGLKGKIIKRAKSFEIECVYGRWIIIPFLVSVNSDKVKIDLAEHTEYKWIDVSEIDSFDGVKGLRHDFDFFGLK